MKAFTVNESLNMLNEKSHVYRASNTFNNINDALHKLYDVMSQSDKNLKDKIFHQYYRFYNDGDVYKFPYDTLERLGMTKEGIRNLKDIFGYNASARRDANIGRGHEYIYDRYKKGIEEAVEVIARYLLKKYGKKLDRSALYLEKRIEIYDD